ERLAFSEDESQRPNVSRPGGAGRLSAQRTDAPAQYPAGGGQHDVTPDPAGLRNRRLEQLAGQQQCEKVP
ncbi:hypothetical protein, partial [Pseudomonas syringae]|uniref:hypothetical protein n=1 Tax=Pseudomonas syringae TaxID=317 RepID=UPI001ABB5000